MRNRHRLHWQSGSHPRCLVLFLLGAICYSIRERSRGRGWEGDDECLPGVFGVGLGGRSGDLDGQDMFESIVENEIIQKHLQEMIAQTLQDIKPLSSSL